MRLLDVCCGLILLAGGSIGSPGGSAGQPLPLLPGPPQQSMDIDSVNIHCHGAVIESFDSIITCGRDSLWRGGKGGPTLALDGIHRVEGSGGVILYADAADKTVAMYKRLDENRAFRCSTMQCTFYAFENDWPCHQCSPINNGTASHPVSYIKFVLSSDTTYPPTNYGEFSLGPQEIAPGWNRPRWSLATMATRGVWTADGPQRMVVIEFKTTPTAFPDSGGGPMHITFDKLVTAENEGLKIIIEFHDTRADALARALPILRKYHFPGTELVWDYYVGKSGYLKQAELDSLSTCGWDIIAHAHMGGGGAPCTSKTEATIDAYYGKTLRYVQAHWPTSGRFVHYGFDCYDSTIIQWLKAKGVLMAIGGEFSYRFAPVSLLDGDAADSAMRYRVPCLDVGNVIATYAEQTAKLDSASTQGGLIIIGFHAIVPQQLDSICSYIARRGFQVVTPSELYRQAYLRRHP